MDIKLKELLKNAPTTLIITPEPLIMEKVGDTFRVVYLGLRAFDKLNPTTGEMERKPVAHFYDGEKVLFNMGAMLTRACELLIAGMSVEIVLKELKANNKGGKTKIYSVAPLDIPRLDLHDLFGGVLEITAPKPEDLRPPAPVAENAPPDESQFQNYSNLHPNTIAKWSALVASAVAAGVRMNYDLGPDETGASLVDRVLAVKAAISEREQRARDKAALFPEDM